MPISRFDVAGPVIGGDFGNTTGFVILAIVPAVVGVVELVRRNRR
ncbi:hypothetical protein [Streptomyces sp. SID3343]|nr:hypothetical protein [Streptomyces sp. SID3343]